MAEREPWSWKRWFGGGNEDGRIANYSLLRSPRGTVFLTVGDMRRGFPSRDVLRAHGFVPDEIQDVGWDVLSAYHDGPPVGFPDGTLVRSHDRPDVFLISQCERRPILSERTFLERGWTWDLILWTDERTVALEPLGEAL